MLGRRTSPAPVVCDQPAFWHLFKDVYPRGKYVKGNIMLVLFYAAFCLNHKHEIRARITRMGSRSHPRVESPQRFQRQRRSACGILLSKTFTCHTGSVNSIKPNGARAPRFFYFFWWACDLYLQSVHDSSRPSACCSFPPFVWIKSN